MEKKYVVIPDSKVPERAWGRIVMIVGEDKDCFYEKDKAAWSKDVLMPYPQSGDKVHCGDNDELNECGKFVGYDVSTKCFVISVGNNLHRWPYLIAATRLIISFLPTPKK